MLCACEQLGAGVVTGGETKVKRGGVYIDNELSRQSRNP